MSANGEKPAKKASDKDLDLSRANRGVWLVKVPKYIAERWEIEPANSEIGQLKIIRNAGQKPLVSFNLSDRVAAAQTNTELRQTSAIPKENKLVMNMTSGQTLAAFSHCAGDPTTVVPTPDKLSLEGKIVQRAECRPINEQVYMKLKMESIIKAIEPTRTAKQITRPVNTYKPVTNHASNLKRDAAKKQAGKKLRDDKNVVMEKLFQMFERHQYWNIKDLVARTNQPVAYLKEILKEVCNYNLKAPHKNMWELKAEFRHYKSEEADEPKKPGEADSDDDAFEDA